MQVAVETINKIERRLTVVVPAEKLEDAFAKQISQIAQTVEIKGFRRGKAPIEQVIKRYGNEARSDAFNEVIRSSLYEALEQEKLQPVSMPRIEPKVMQPNQPLEFVATFEVYPEVSDVQFSLDKVEKLIVSITDEDVTRVVNQLLDQHAKYKSVSRTAQMGDQVIIDFYPVEDGKANMEHQQKGFSLLLGKNTMIPGFEDGIVGMNVDEEKTLNLTFPADFFVKERAGQTVGFVITLKQVLEAERPAMDAEFIKSLGIESGSEDELRTEIKTNLERERDRVTRVKVRDQIFKKLLEQNPMDIPQALIQQEAKHIHDEMHPSHRGDHNHNHSPEETLMFMTMAKERVTLGILVAAFVKKHQLAADATRLQARIKEIAGAYENSEEMVRRLESNRQQRAFLETQILEEQVVDKLLESITIEEKAVSYQELIAQ